MSKLLNIPKEQLRDMRAAAETEAQSILKSRTVSMRAAAETEAQSILKSRTASMRAAAETEAQGILKSRTASKRAANKTKRKAESDAKSTLEIERINAEVRKAEADKEPTFLEVLYLSIKAIIMVLYYPYINVLNRNRKRITLGAVTVIILIILFSVISSTIKSCSEDREAEQFYTSSSTEEVADESDDVDDVMAEVQEQIARTQAEVEAQMAQVQADVKAQLPGSSSSKDVKEALKKQFDYVYSLSHGFYKIEKNGKYGLANEQGQVVANPVYSYIYSQNSKTGLIKVEIDGKYGFLNAQGKEVMKPKYTYIYNTDSGSGLTKVEISGKYGFVDLKKMKEVVPCIYTYIYSLRGGLYKVEQGSKTGFLNKDGSVHKKPE